MGRYQAYPEYKDSGVEWLGDIPADWSVSKLKHVASIHGRIGFRGYTVDDIVDEGEGAIVLSPSNIDGDTFDLNKKVYLSWFKYYESPEIMVNAGDILLVKTGSTYGKSAIIRALDEPMTINPQMAILKNSKVDPRYLAYLMSSSLIKAKIDISNTGSGMPTMTQENINNFPIPHPKDNLDIHIANFLDHETAKIDTLIEQQQQLIQLLKEKRQAVISHAVTKGLNPNAPMKDSGVEWLGEVPAHWDVKNIGRISDVKRGSGYQNIDMEIEGKECIGMLRISDMHSVEPITIVKTNEVMRYTVQAGDILVAGTGATAGISMIVDAKDHGLVHSYNSIMIRTKGNLIVSKFIHYFLCSDYISSVLDVSFVGSAQPFVDTNGLRKLPILIPPNVEQQKIVQYLNEKLQKLSELFEHAEHMVSILNERRTALISAAVTGKIDVRNWQAPQ